MFPRESGCRYRIDIQRGKQLSLRKRHIGVKMRGPSVSAASQFRVKPRRSTATLALVAALCAAVSAIAAVSLRGQMDRKPTAPELSAAATAAVVGRWHTW
jgi:hypothetical protein